MIPRSEWEWFGYPGHLIIARWCQFRLCTKVGAYLISTVGDWHSPIRGEQVSERKPIGAGDDSFFETYVFTAGARCTEPDCGCMQPSLASGSEIDGVRTATAGEAQRAHLEFCEKYAALEPPP